MMEEDVMYLSDSREYKELVNWIMHHEKRLHQLDVAVAELEKKVSALTLSGKA